jgi:hypothetical protein
MVIKGQFSGSFVDVLDFCGDTDAIGPNGAMEHAKDAWYITRPKGDARYPGRKCECVSPDSWLLPIRPGELDDTEEGRKVLEFTE